MLEIVPIADHLIFATGLGDPEKARPHEERALAVTQALGVFGGFTRLDINLDRDPLEITLGSMAEKVEERLERDETVALCGFSVGGSASLLEYIHLKRELPPDLAKMLSVYLVASRVRGLDRINQANYVDSGFSTEQGYRNLLQAVGACEGIARSPYLGLEIVSGIHVIRGESDDRMRSRDTKIKSAAPAIVMEEVDTHTKAHSRFLAHMGTYLAAAQALVSAHVAGQASREPAYVNYEV